MIPTVEIDTLAYIDSPLGLVKCKVKGARNGMVTVRVTQSTGGYGRGNMVTINPIRIIPRAAVFFRQGVATIRPYHALVVLW